MAGTSPGENLNSVLERIAAAARRVQRDPKSISLVAVSKTHPVVHIRALYECGQKIFGENYVQEGCEKIAQLPSEIQWHFIGSLQRNKVKMMIERFALIHSIDSWELAQEVSRRAQMKDKVQDILLQIRIGGEQSKGGVDPEQTEELAKQILDLPHVRLRGLMTIPPPSHNELQLRGFFHQLRELREQLRGRLGTDTLAELSMGMSSDFEIAIEEGATIVRIGTLLFGQRPQK